MKGDTPYWWCDNCLAFTHGIQFCEICGERKAKNPREIGSRVLEDWNVGGRRVYEVRRSNGRPIRFVDRREAVPYFYREDTLAVSNGRSRAVETEYGVADGGFLSGLTSAPVDFKGAYNGIVEDTVYFGDGRGRRVRYTCKSDHIGSLGRKASKGRMRV